MILREFPINSTIDSTFGAKRVDDNINTTMIRGGTVVNHDKAEVADVLVQDGKIVAVGQDLELPQVQGLSVPVLKNDCNL